MINAVDTSRLPASRVAGDQERFAEALAGVLTCEPSLTALLEVLVRASLHATGTPESATAGRVEGHTVRHVASSARPAHEDTAVRAGHQDTALQVGAADRASDGQPTSPRTHPPMKQMKPIKPIEPVQPIELAELVEALGGFGAVTRAPVLLAAPHDGMAPTGGRGAIGSVPLSRGGRTEAVLALTSQNSVGITEADLALALQLWGVCASRLDAAEDVAESTARELRLRQALDRALDGHAIYDAVCDASGRVVDLRGVYINQAAAELRGLDTPDQWLGRGLLERRQDLGSPLIDRFLAVAQTGERVTFDLDLPTGRGLRTTSVTATRRGDTPQSGISAVWHDRTEERGAAEVIEDQRRQLAAGQRLAHVGSWEWRRSPDEAGGIFDGAGHQTWSAEFYALLDFPPGRVVPSAAAFLDAVHPADRQPLKDAILAPGEGGPASFEFRVMLPGGELRWLQGTSEVELGGFGEPIRIWGTALDITERRQAERHLAEAEKQFRLAMDLAPVGIALVALDGTVLRVNRALSALLGLGAGYVGGDMVQSYLNPADVMHATVNAAHLLAGDVPRAEGDLRLRAAHGEVWVRASGSLLFDDDGALRHVIVHVQDISERQARQADLERQANTDPLSGLPNRRGWEHLLGEHLDEAARTGAPLAIGLIDLDHFKVFNDTFGHPAGDRLLAEVSGLWSGRLREIFAAEGTAPTIARIGGEEFAVALPHCSVEQARAVLVELCSMTTRGQSASAGITVWEPSEESSETLARADGALYAAKRKGRRRVIAVLPV